MRKFFLFSLLLFSMGAAALWLTPWDRLLEGQIRKTLLAQGFREVSLHVSSWGLHGVTLEDLQLGRDAPLRFKNVRVSYALAGLRHNQFQELTILGPALQLRQTAQGWVVEGAEAFFAVDEKAPAPSVSSLTALLQALPFETIALSEGTLSIAGHDLEAGLPLSGRYVKETGTITYQGDQARLRKGALNALAQALSATLTWDAAEQQWQGTWQIGEVKVEAGSADVPPLKANGTVLAAGATLKIEGRLQSADRAYHLDFIYEYSLERGKPAMLSVNNATMPWKQGRLKLASFKMPLDGVARDWQLNVQAEELSVGELLGALTGERVQATGTISGALPVTLKSNGDILFHQGSLKTAAPGKIIMPPDAIPGDNEQIKLVRDIMGDLNYTNLAISMDSDQRSDLGILMTVEGNNPAVYNGRAVKLNVRLTGDVLDFIRQNVMLLTKPEALWEQDNAQPTKP